MALCQSFSANLGEIFRVSGASIGFSSLKTAAIKAESCQSLTNSQLPMNPQTPTNSFSRTIRFKNKGGRPKKPQDECRKCIVKVAFDRDNYAKLCLLRDEQGKSLSQIVYDFAVNGCIREALPQDVARYIRALAGMANNLNQLAHEAHIIGYDGVEQRDKSLAQEIDRLLRALDKMMT